MNKIISKKKKNIYRNFSGINSERLIYHNIVYISPIYIGDFFYRFSFLMHTVVTCVTILINRSKGDTDVIKTKNLYHNIVCL